MVERELNRVTSASSASQVRSDANIGARITVRPSRASRAITAPSGLFRQLEALAEP
jgi:hypothetical protein